MEGEGEGEGGWGDEEGKLSKRRLRHDSGKRYPGTFAGTAILPLRPLIEEDEERIHASPSR